MAVSAWGRRGADFAQTEWWPGPIILALTAHVILKHPACHDVQPVQQG
jgi:hypothetical protein